MELPRLSQPHTSTSLSREKQTLHPNVSLELALSVVEDSSGGAGGVLRSRVPGLPKKFGAAGRGACCDSIWVNEITTSINDRTLGSIGE